MLDAALKVAPTIGVIIAGVLMWALWRRVKAGRVGAQFAAALSAALLLAVLGILILPRVVFHGLAGRSDMYGPWAWAALGLGAVATAGLLAGALIGDRSRGRRRCPACWYDMSATPPPGLVCSECGHDAGRERRLFLSRRSRRAIVLSFVPLLAGSALYGVWLRNQNTWASAMPTIVLIGASPWAGANDLGGEINTRMFVPSSHMYGAAEWERWLQTRASRLVLSVRSDPKSVLFHAELLKTIERDTPGTTTAVIALVDSPDLYVRQHAAYLLGSLRGDPEAAERALIGLAGSATARVRERAVYSLCEIKARRPGGAAPAEIIALAQPPVTVPAAVNLLGMYAPSATTRALFMSIVGRSTGWARDAHAAGALANQYPGDPEVQAVVIAELREPAADPYTSMLATLRWVDESARRANDPALVARLEPLYTSEVRRAIIDSARTMSAQSGLITWLMNVSSFTEQEREELRRISDGTSPP